MCARGRAATGLAALLGASLCAGLALAVSAPQKSIRDGVFTTEQVQQGKALFEEVCGKCHTPDLFGPDYMLGWSGATVGEFFVQLQTTMPYESPGTLTDEEYAAVLVYMFAINGVGAGEQALGTVVNELYGISIEGPFKWTEFDH